MKQPKIQSCKAFSLHISGVEQGRTHTLKFIEKYAYVAHTRLASMLPDLDYKNLPLMSFHVRSFLSILPALATCSLPAAC